MPNFAKYSNFDPDASFGTLKYAADALMLEVELNEAQNIMDNKIRTLVKDKFGDVFHNTGSSLTYSGGDVTFANDKAFANGNPVVISSLVLTLAEGETAYLDVWEEEVSFSSILKKYGNQQEINTVTNYIKDIRTAEETSRRSQVQYDLVKATGVDGHTYLPVCTITGGALVDNRIKTGEDIATNTTDIATNTTDIATNAGGISTNAGGISTNAGGISTNAGGISTNAGGIEALLNSSANDAGEIKYFARSTAPAGYLKADGATISRTTYGNLFAAIGTTFGAGDGSTTFKVPDLRGEHIRGWDDGKGVDAGRALGSSQADANKAHEHAGNTEIDGDHTHVYFSSTLNTQGNASGTGQLGQAGSWLDTGNTEHQHAFTTDSDGGPEVRVKNIALLAVIRY